VTKRKSPGDKQKPGPSKKAPLFDRTIALLLSERYIKGDTYQSFAEELGVSAGRVQRCMEFHKVLSKDDKRQHWVAVMDKRREAGIQVGRKGYQPK
jgi:adenylate cyclase